ncbi:MAG: hypothetical protein ACTJLL_02100 [Anaplasma sp.]
MKDGSSVEVAGDEQLWLLIYFLHVAVAILLLMNNGGLLVLAEMGSLAFGLVVLVLFLFYLMFERYPWLDLRDAASRDVGHDNVVVRRLFMLHDVTLAFLSTMLLCVLISRGSAHNGLPSACCWMATWEIAFCGALISLWCLYIACRASGALMGLCADCMPPLRGGCNLADEARMRVEECLATNVGVHCAEVGFCMGR